MTVFIELDVLVEFELICDKRLHLHKVLHDLLTEYVDVEIVLDTEEYISLIDDVPLLSNLFNYNNSIQVKEFEEYFRECNILPFQSILFLKSTKIDSEKIKDLGGLVIYYDDFENSIEQIINKGSLDIDFSETDLLFEWSKLDKLKELPLTKTIISDDYVLVDSNNQKIESNLLDMLKHILPTKPFRIPLEILTDFNEMYRYQKGLNIEEKVSKALRFLNSNLTGLNQKIRFIDRHLATSEFKFHDRLLYSDFYMIEVGAGFNLVPKPPMDTYLRSRTIFDKTTYKRMNNHRKNLDKYLLHISRESFQTLNLKIYPL